MSWARIVIAVVAGWLGACLWVGNVTWANESPSAGPTVRLKDIARVQGVRDNQLFGLGLVIGLEGTGDSPSAAANVQMIANMLQKFGVALAPNQLRVRNAAAVMVTATLPAFARVGDTLDVTVSSFGDARSLQGGYLLQTPLEAANGQVYAVAQGPISIGGFNVSAGGATTQKNHTAVGRVPRGALVEREVETAFHGDQDLTLVLQNPDFTHAARVAAAVNERFGRDLAVAIDRSAVRVAIPDDFSRNVVRFISDLEELPIATDPVARVVVNERTGTVVMGSTVRIATVAVAHGGLTVRVEPNVQVVQPPPLSPGETVVTRTARVEADERSAHMVVLPATANVEDLVNALNAIGASPRDLIAVLQAIEAAGALYGELLII